VIKNLCVFDASVSGQALEKSCCIGENANDFSLASYELRILDMDAERGSLIEDKKPPFFRESARWIVREIFSGFLPKFPEFVDSESRIDIAG
jgi:hypothetical protein